MHELAITESVVSGVSDHVGDARVVRVVLEIGRLSGVVPEAVRFCFPVCAEGTTLEGAVLDIVEIPGRGLCRACGAEAELEDPIPLCHCGSADLELLAGQELRVREVEVI
jgi:hydrogenase nickel incorporation protein HypA/HybF